MAHAAGLRRAGRRAARRQRHAGRPAGEGDPRRGRGGVAGRDALPALAVERRGRVLGQRRLRPAGDVRSADRGPGRPGVLPPCGASVRSGRVVCRMPGRHGRRALHQGEHGDSGAPVRVRAAGPRRRTGRAVRAMAAGRRSRCRHHGGHDRVSRRSQRRRGLARRRRLRQLVHAGRRGGRARQRRQLRPGRPRLAGAARRPDARRRAAGAGRATVRRVIGPAPGGRSHVPAARRRRAARRGRCLRAARALGRTVGGLVGRRARALPCRRAVRGAARSACSACWRGARSGPDGSGWPRAQRSSPPGS